MKEVLRQYELRERHFECVIRSKELEVLLSRARAAEQKQLAEGEKIRADKLEDEVCTFLDIDNSILVHRLDLRVKSQHLRKELEDAQRGQTMLVDRLITCCKEVCPSWSLFARAQCTDCFIYSQMQNGHNVCLHLFETSWKSGARDKVD